MVDGTGFFTLGLLLFPLPHTLVATAREDSTALAVSDGGCFHVRDAGYGYGDVNFHQDQLVLGDDPEFDALHAPHAGHGNLARDSVRPPTIGRRDLVDLWRLLGRALLGIDNPSLSTS